MDRELLKRELAVYGVLLNTNGTCTIIENEDRLTVPIDKEIVSLKDSIVSNRQLFKELWQELIDMLANPSVTIVAGSISTGCMFIAGLKHLFHIAVRSGSKKAKYIIKQQLKRDINDFSESFMTKIIDYKIGLDWVHHLIEADSYRLQLLSALLKIDQNEKKAIQGPWSNLDLPMQERVWNYSEEGENLNDRDQEIQKQQRYQIPDTYNDPYDFEEGFYYREMRNEPYEFGDDDDNPYPHRNLLWDS